MKKIIYTSLILFLPVILFGQIDGPTFDNGVVRVRDAENSDVKLERSNQKSYSLDGSRIFNIAEKGDFNKYFPSGSMPSNIILSNELEGYESIGVVYQQVVVNDIVYGFLFHYLYKQVGEELIITFDSDLDNDYTKNAKRRVFALEAYDFTLNYTIEGEELSIEFKNPFRDPSIFVKEYFSEGLKLSFLGDVEFGLGGFGKEAYTLSYSDPEVSSTVNYNYEYRTGHFAFSPSIVFRNFGLNVNAIYEIRQPRNGFETVYFNNELIRSDNGVANIFPKARLVLNYGVFYQFLISNTLIVRPYLNYGNFRFTGFASEDFNDVRFTKDIITYGSKFVFPTSSKGGFYLNLSFSNDLYDAERNIKVRDGNTYLHNLDDNYIANQFNISFGYSIKVF